MRTYDDWKLERARRAGRFAGLRRRDPDEQTCRNCDSPDLARLDRGRW